MVWFGRALTLRVRAPRASALQFGFRRFFTRWSIGGSWALVCGSKIVDHHYLPDRQVHSLPLILDLPVLSFVLIC